jgi:hypothetical protein
MIMDRPLTSNGYTLSSTDDRLSWLQPSDPAEPVPALRERYQQQGDLWLKGLLESLHDSRLNRECVTRQPDASVHRHSLPVGQR